MATTTYTSASSALLDRGVLIKQGAEAKVYALPSLLPQPAIFNPSSSSAGPSTITNTDSGVILKYRFPKTYRHPTLDASLTASRLTFEARSLSRAAKAGVVVPKVIYVDEKGGVLGLERVEGWSVREILGGGAEGEVEVEEDEVEVELAQGEEGVEGESAAEEEEGEGDNEGMSALRRLGVTQEHLMRSIGAALARLHLTTIIHGDLTTSNMMVRLTPGGIQPYEIVMIDFGLSSTAQFPENYAVDLYVLERAFASTHPQSENLYAGVLEAYEKGLGEKKWRPIEIKLKEVRRRGRKRDMTG
ncbi:EKC/KEOPS complex subunit BUD32 [Kwoniella shandongensis]|uniref:EKC/KEOPS complex subunit BUD32 n=1 Tax=Kwoniella shandongensis TaxID=1734106 RepID=A0A5M6C769_9TREE|nr:EKC/KEOPS complex subunit BUD32 [Kwoniella shandongensis]KAA5530721.1 EKC/KEOPS complex subunit BUD32 [Kwoniella shandongensis]